MGMGEPVALKLQELGLEQYASAIVDDQGYNMVETLQSLSAEELGELADDVKMKPGHKRTFLSGFGTSASTAARIACTTCSGAGMAAGAAPSPSPPALS